MQNVPKSGAVLTIPFFLVKLFVGQYLSSIETTNNKDGGLFLVFCSNVALDDDDWCPFHRVCLFCVPKSQRVENFFAAALLLLKTKKTESFSTPRQLLLLFLLRIFVVVIGITI